jgi:hypothetical protein
MPGWRSRELIADERDLLNDGVEGLLPQRGITGCDEAKEGHQDE